MRRACSTSSSIGKCLLNNNRRCFSITPSPIRHPRARPSFQSDDNYDFEETTTNRNANRTSDNPSATSRSESQQQQPSSQRPSSSSKKSQSLPYEIITTNKPWKPSPPTPTPKPQSSSPSKLKGFTNTSFTSSSTSITSSSPSRLTGFTNTTSKPSKTQLKLSSKHQPTSSTGGSRKPRSERETPPDYTDIASRFAKPHTHQTQKQSKETTEDSSSSPKKPRQTYNLSKIRFLAGWEKIDLLRQFQAAHLTHESLHVYKILSKNKLLDRLKYLDHHEMFHLLLHDPLRYREGLLLVWKGFEECGLVKSDHLYGLMLFCCLKWGDRGLAREIWESCVKEGIKIGVDGYNHLLRLFSMDVLSIVDAQVAGGGDGDGDKVGDGNNDDDGERQLRMVKSSPTTSDLLLAREVYENLVTPETSQSQKGGSLLEPNATTFILAMNLHGKLNDPLSIREIYTNKVIPLLPRFRIDQQQMSKVSRRARERGGNLVGEETVGGDVGLNLGNATVAALMDAGDLDGAEAVVKAMMEPGGAMAMTEQRQGDGDSTDVKMSGGSSNSGGGGGVKGRAGTAGLNLMLKLAVRKAEALEVKGGVGVTNEGENNTNEQGDPIQFAKRIWQDATTSRGITPDLTSYGRLIELYGISGSLKDSENWFQTACDRLPGLEEGHGSGKLMRLRTALMRAIKECAVRARRDGNRLLAKEYAGKAVELMGMMKVEADIVGKTPLRSAFLFAKEACVAGGDLDTARFYGDWLEE
ncbi:hypothetical protein HDU76_005489 [Blyttiomyces sp. JEL0837]|nr:hypothetical protein HDU76_005489 [Blyttiomyces sp. JEL0837]